MVRVDGWRARRFPTTVGGPVPPAGVAAGATCGVGRPAFDDGSPDRGGTWIRIRNRPCSSGSPAGTRPCSRAGTGGNPSVCLAVVDARAPLSPKVLFTHRSLHVAKTLEQPAISVHSLAQDALPAGTLRDRGFLRKRPAAEQRRREGAAWPPRSGSSVRFAGSSCFHPPLRLPRASSLAVGGEESKTAARGRAPSRPAGISGFAGCVSQERPLQRTRCCCAGQARGPAAPAAYRRRSMPRPLIDS